MPAAATRTLVPHPALEADPPRYECGVLSMRYEAWHGKQDSNLRRTVLETGIIAARPFPYKVTIQLSNKKPTPESGAVTAHSETAPYTTHPCHSRLMRTALVIGMALLCMSVTITPVAANLSSLIRRLASFASVNNFSDPLLLQQQRNNAGAPRYEGFSYLFVRNRAYSHALIFNRAYQIHASIVVQLLDAEVNIADAHPFAIDLNFFHCGSLSVVLFVRIDFIMKLLDGGSILFHVFL
jgi:multisubunit Na+/H+ antiporter MnhC subunit